MITMVVQAAAVKLMVVMVVLFMSTDGGEAGGSGVICSDGADVLIIFEKRPQGICDFCGGMVVCGSR